MNHVKLDLLNERVQKLVLGFALEPGGSVLEFNGQPIAVVVPSGTAEATGESWTDEKNDRRRDLIRREYTVGLTSAEAVELVRSQAAALRHHNHVAPLPLEETRRLYQELLNKAARAEKGE